MVAPATSTQQPIRFGKYLLVERLGRGGMAEVWKAKMVGPAGFQRTVVVKRILPHLAEDPHFVQMFVAEARLSAKLNHSNIVQVHELGDVEGEYYLAMEYLRGRDLVSVMRAHLMRSVPPPGLGALCIRDVCRALGYAHALNDDRGNPLRLIHRDVSPSNVMLSFDGQIKLLDFGIAKALSEASENKTQTGTLKGKFGYMAPEQVEGKEIDHRTDLFAAGVMLHETLTGRRLFKGTSDIQTMALVREAKVPPPSSSNPEVPLELDRICLKALAREPGDRYPTCEQMAADLDHVVHQLRWGPERVSGLLKELFPDEPSGTGQVILPSFHGLDIDGPSGASPRRRWRYAAGALALVGAVTVVTVELSRSHHPVVAPVQAAATPKPAPAPKPVPAAPLVPATITVHLQTTPPSLVFIDDESESRGRTPLSFQLPRDTAKVHQMHLRADGYVEQTVDLPSDSDSRYDLTLARVHVASTHTASRPVRHDHPVASKPAAKADLKGGAVVDPFSN